MARLFSSDMHFDHANIIGYCGRPFADPDEMAAALVERWNAVVGDDDEVWCLGDIALGQGVSGLRWVSALAGRKVLVPGNHDRVAPYLKRADRFVEAYLGAGFAEIVPGPASLTVGGVPVTVDHFPYAGDSHDSDRFTDRRPADRGGWLLHGHVHERWRQRGRMINVGVDAWGGRPVDEATLAAVIAAGPADTAPLPWEEAKTVTPPP
ncbi:MAG TPA: metallophosphoesterase family protein [Acidimicrobiales bacterium]|nr:metallophosphoesterase family protein [Acidimicrobiales bacterium]